MEPIAGPLALLDSLDALLDPLPEAVKLMVWAAVAAAASMALYAALSPQRRIARAAAEAVAARGALERYDGELAGAWPLIGRALRTAGRRLWLVLPATLVASLPVLVLLGWLSATYGYRFPDEDSGLPARITPAGFEGELLVAPQEPAEAPGRRIMIADIDGAVLAELPLRQPVPTLEKRRWWHALLGHGAGYLPEEAPIARVEVDLPRRDVLPLGPAWLRSWEAPFFLMLLACSLAIKHLARIA